MTQAFNIGNLVATIGANLTPLNLALKQANANMKASATKMSASMDVVNAKMMKTSKAMKTVGMGFTKSLTAPIALIGGLAMKVGMDFESAMSQVQATMGVTKDKMGDLTAIAKEMGASTKFSATESAEGLNFLALAGYNADQQISALPKVLTLATAGNMDLAAASDMLTDSMSALGLASEDSAVLSSNMNIMVDQMAKVSSKANTSVSQLGEAILSIGGTAKNLKGGTTELNTSLGLLADNGIKGSEAGIMLRNMTLAMTPTTAAAADAFKQLGLQTYDTEGNLRSFQDIFGDLNTSMKDMTSEEKMDIMNKIFNKRDLKAVSALMGTTTQRWTELTNEVANSAGAGQKMADTQLDNWKGMLTILKSSLEGFLLKISEVLMPVMKKFTAWIQGITDKLNKMSPELIQNILKWAAMAAAIGPLILIGSKLVAAIGAISKAISFMNLIIAANPFVAIGVAIAAVGVALVVLWKKFAGFRAVVKFTAAKVVEYWNYTWTALKMGAEIWWETIKAYFSFIPKMAKIAGKAIAAIFDKDKKVGDVLKEEWEKYASSIVDTAKDIKEKYKAQFAAIKSPDYKTILAAEQASQAAKDAGKAIKNGLASGMGGEQGVMQPTQTMGEINGTEMMPEMESKGFTLGIADEVGLEVEKLQTNSAKLVGVATQMKNDLGKVFVDLGAIIKDSLVSGITAFSESLANIATGTGNMKDLFKTMLGVIADFVGTLGKALIAAGIGALSFDALLANPPAAIAAGAALVGLAAVVSNLLSSAPDTGGGGEAFGGNLRTIAVPAAANGALAYSPSMVQVGDNPRARFDPEVIKPASHLEKLLNVPQNVESGTTFSDIPSEIVMRLKNGDLQAMLRLNDTRNKNLGK